MMFLPRMFGDDAYAEEIVRQQYIITWGREPSRKELRRPVYITPFPGGMALAYKLAGYVVTIDGEPPKMIAIVTDEDYYKGPTVYLLGVSEFEVVTNEGPEQYLRLRAAILALVKKARRDHGCP